MGKDSMKYVIVIAILAMLLLFFGKAFGEDEEEKAENQQARKGEAKADYATSAEYLDDIRSGAVTGKKEKISMAPKDFVFIAKKIKTAMPDGWLYDQDEEMVYSQMKRLVYMGDLAALNLVFEKMYNYDVTIFLKDKMSDSEYKKVQVILAKLK